MSIELLNESNFKNKIENEEKTVLVDFYADWCGPCKMVGPIIEEIAEENPNLAVYKVDVDANQGLAREYRVMSIPTIISFKNGEIHKTLIGAQSKEKILEITE